MLLTLASVACREQPGSLREIYPERTGKTETELLQYKEIADQYLESITKPLYQYQSAERSFFRTWNEFSKKCDLWTYATLDNDKVNSELMSFLVSVAVKRKNHPKEDTGNLGEQMLGSNGRLLVPVKRLPNGVVFDEKARKPGHVHYRRVLRDQVSIKGFIQNVSYCFDQELMH